MTQRLVDKPPGPEDYINDFLNDDRIKEQLFRVGSEGFVNKGRGVVVVDLRSVADNQNIRFYYLSAGKGGQWDDQEMAEVCHSYDPEQEVIVYLFYGSYSPKNFVYKIGSER